MTGQTGYFHEDHIARYAAGPCMYIGSTQTSFGFAVPNTLDVMAMQRLKKDIMNSKVSDLQVNKISPKGHPERLSKPIYLLSSISLVGLGLLLWLSPFPGGILLIRWGILYACKASPKLRAFFLKLAKRTRLGSLLLPV